MTHTILVTGGAGYIGSHMVKLLTKTGHRVIVFDNLSRGHADAVGQGELIIGDLLDRSALDQVFARFNIDAVLHFAAFAYVGESMQQPDMYFRNNVVGSISLLDAMNAARVRHLVFSSTCATYGVTNDDPIKEDLLQNPVNPYGQSKLMVEKMLADYANAFGLNSIALRYFNAAGCDPDGELGERHYPETHLIPLVLQEALRVRLGGDPKESRLAVFGTDFPTADGTCIRDYIHVTDLCSAHVHALDRLLGSDAQGFTPYNLGNGSGFSVKQVINAARSVTGVDLNYQEQARRAGDPPILIGSAKKATDELGWHPRYNELETIIGTAWNWVLREQKRKATDSAFRKSSIVVS